VPKRRKTNPHLRGDAVAHRGPTLKGEFARTLNLTEVHIGWVFTAPCATTPIPTSWALKLGLHEIAYEITDLDFGYCTKFLNKEAIRWPAQMEILLTR
jgi:hypothetical protein